MTLTLHKTIYDHMVHMFWPSWIVFISNISSYLPIIEGKVNDYVIHGDCALNDHLLMFVSISTNWEGCQKPKQI
jgi:hypothetical protein